MANNKKFYTIGEAAERCGVATSTLRFYEKKGLIHSIRTHGNQRRYHSTSLRTISIVRAAHKLGIPLDEVGDALSTLPDTRQPTKKDWEKMSKLWAHNLDQRILEMQRLRNYMNVCIGCGCLSLKVCQLFNPNDKVASHGPGPRYLIEGIPDLEK